MCLCVAPTARSGPPFITDDPEPVEYQHWEFYLASMDFKTPSDSFGTGPHVEVNYGIVPNVQLHLLAPLAYDSPSVGRAHYGYGDTELGVKFRFIQETPGMAQVGIFPLLEVPTGNARETLGTGHLHAFLPLWMQKSFGDWTIYGGAGYGINPGAGNQNWGYGGLVAQRQVLKNLLLGAELYHQTAMTMEGRGDTAFNIGTVIDFNEHQHLLLSVGRSLEGPTNFQAYIAWQFTFGFDLSQHLQHAGQGTTGLAGYAALPSE